MKTKHVLLTVFIELCLMLLLISGTTLAGKQNPVNQDNNGNHLGQTIEKPEIEKMMPQDLDKLLLMGLNLTTEQKELIKTEVLAYWVVVKEIRTVLMQLEADLVKEFLKEEIIPATLTDLQTQISAQKALLDMKKLELLIKIKEISPELADMLMLKVKVIEKFVMGHPGVGFGNGGLPPGQDD